MKYCKLFKNTYHVFWRQSDLNQADCWKNKKYAVTNTNIFFFQFSSILLACFALAFILDILLIGMLWGC